MSVIRISSRAQSDLEEIADYLVGVSPSVAERVLDAIRGTLVALALSPKIGRRREDLLENLRIHPAHPLRIDM